MQYRLIFFVALGRRTRRLPKIRRIRKDGGRRKPGILFWINVEYDMIKKRHIESRTLPEWIMT